MNLLDGMEEFNKTYKQDSSKVIDKKPESQLVSGMDSFDSDPTAAPSDKTEPAQVDNIDEYTKRRIKIDSLYEMKAASYQNQLDKIDNVPADKREIVRNKLLEGAIATERERIETINRIDENISKERETQARTKEAESSPDVADRAIGTMTLGIAGARRLTQGLAKELVNITGMDATEINQEIASREEYIADKMDELGFDKDSLMNPADLGQLAAEFAIPLAKLKGIIKTSLGVGALTTAAEVGKGESRIEAVKSGAIAAATTGALFPIGWAVKAGASRIAGRFTGITPVAKLAGAKVGLSGEELSSFLKGVPKQDQTLKLAEAYPDLLGNFKQALNDSDKIKIITSDLIQNRTDQVNKAAQKGDFPAIKEAAEDTYSTMKEVLTGDTGIRVDLSDLTDGLNLAKRIGGDEAAIAKIKGFKNQIKDRPNMDLGDVVDIREGINDLYRRSKGKSRATYMQLKKSLDDKLSDVKNVPEEYQSLLTDSVSIYRDMKQQEELLSIINKASETRGLGGAGEKTAINYAKVKEGIRDAKLNSPVVDSALEIVEAFEKKFNSDYQIFGATATKGVSTQEGALGIASKIISVAKENLWRVGEYGDDVAIQKSIRNALKNAKTPVDFVGRVSRDKNIPMTISDKLKSNLENISNLSTADANRIKALQSSRSTAQSNPVAGAVSAIAAGAAIAGGAGNTTPPVVPEPTQQVVPAEIDKTWKTNKPDVTKMSKKQRIETIQALIGTDPDGKWGKKSRAAMAKVASGNNTELKEQIQHMVGTKVDGDWKSKSNAALNKLVLQKDKNTSTLKAPTYGASKASIKDLQKKIGATVDGDWGMRSKAKLDQYNGISNYSVKDKNDFVKQVKPEAERVAKKIGKMVDPSWLVTMWRHETANGQSGVTQNTYNLGNVKDFKGDSWKGDSFDAGMVWEDDATGKATKEKSSFRKYKNFTEAANDFVKFLSTKRYAKAREAATKREFFQALKNAGYATDSKYVDKMMKL